jgi:Zn-dependent protease
MEQLLIALPVLIFSVVLHEVAHGWVARSQGDPTAAMLGRLTLNPIPHLDPIGSLLVPAMLALLPGGVIFGWAKPVPVNPRNFRNYKKGDILVSLAGVAANLLLAIAFILMLAGAVWGSRLVPGLGATWELVMEMARYGIIINFVLILFNLIPIPPLDGSHVMYHLLPPHLGARYRELGRYGMLILFALLFLGGFEFLRWPLRILMGAADSLVRLFI